MRLLGKAATSRVAVATRCRFVTAMMRAARRRGQALLRLIELSEIPSGLLQSVRPKIAPGRRSPASMASEENSTDEQFNAS